MNFLCRWLLRKRLVREAMQTVQAEYRVGDFWGPLPGPWRRPQRAPIVVEGKP